MSPPGNSSQPPEPVWGLRASLDRLLGGVLVALMAALVGCVVWQVVTRFVAGRPSSFTEELARYLLIWLGLLGATRALGEGQHLALGLFASGSSTLARWLRFVPPLAGVLFSVTVMLFGGTQLSRLTWQLSQSSAALGVPLAVVYAVVPLSGLIMLFYSASDLLETAGRRPATTTTNAANANRSED